MVKTNRLSIRELTFIAVFSALLIAAQVTLSVLPNIELVSILIISATFMLGYKIIYVLIVFVAVEGIIYGFGLWWFSYTYVWGILAFISILFRKERNPLVWALISGGFGLLFGTLCSIVYFIALGFSGGLAWLISGFPFDIIHGISNFVIALVLSKPLFNVIDRFSKLR